MVTIASGATSLQVLPEAGGLISYYRTQRADRAVDWLIPRSDQHAGSFVMIPFASRVAHGAFRFQGRLIHLKPNMDHERYPIHGFGWLREWQVLEHHESSLCLRYAEDSDDWPWAFHADLTISLEEASLSLDFKVVNDAPAPMPLGLGFHPYFPVSAACSVSAVVSHQWHLDDQLIPTDMERVDPGHWYPARERLDTVYAGWQREARLVWPERGAELTISASEHFEHFVIYSQDDFFCAEPISNMVDGFNMMARGEEGHGVTVLESGEEMSAWVKLEPRHE